MKTRYTATVVVLAWVWAAMLPAYAGSDFWSAPVNGDFMDNLGWLDGTAPASGDSATFDVGGTYTVTFLSNAVNQNLFLRSGNVTFLGAGFPYTYRLTGGGGNVNLLGGTLTLSGTAGGALDLTAENRLHLQNANLNVLFGSRMSAASLELNEGLIVVDGAGPAGPSRLNISGDADVWSTTGGIRLQNGSTGNSIAGTLNFAQTGLAFSVFSGSSLSTGSIQGSPPGPGGFAEIRVMDPGSSWAQTGASSLTWGSSTGTPASLIVDSGGSFTTGTGATTLHSTGAINIANGGTFVANGDLLVNTSGGTGDSVSGAVKLGVYGNSTFVQNGATSFTMGHPLTGPTTVQIVGGTLTTGTGPVTIHATGLVDVTNGGKLNANGDLLVNAAGGTGVSALEPLRLNVAGTGSAVTQTGATALTVGNPTTGTARVAVGSGASYTTGSGGATLRRTGELMLYGGSTFNLNGPMLIDGGRLGLSGALNPVTGATITAQNDGLIDRAGGAFTVDRNATVQLLSGADLLNIGPLSVGRSTNGTLWVDGAGSTVGGNPLLLIGTLGAAGSATFSHGAGVSPATIFIGSGPEAKTAGTAGTLNIESGTQVALPDYLYVGLTDDGTGAPVGRLTVTGSGSRLAQTNAGRAAVVGQASGGSGTVQVNDGATLSIASPTTINATGALNINGGSVELGVLNLVGGKVNFSSGSLRYTGDLNVGTAGMLGADLALPTGKSLTLSGTTAIDPDARLALRGGSLSTGGLINAGTLLLDGGALATGSSGIVNAPIGRLAIGADAALAPAGPVANYGEISLAGGSAAIAGSGPLDNAGVILGSGRIARTLNNTPTGEVRVDFSNRILLSAPDNVNDGRISLSFGGTLESPARLINGPGGTIAGDGVLRAGQITYTAGPVPSGNGLFTYGKMNFSGTTKVYGDVWIEGGDATDVIVSGGATMTFYDDVFMLDTAAGAPKPEIRAGSGSRVVYFGTVKGNVNMTGSGVHSIEGVLSPGFSPGYLPATNLELTSSGTFAFDLAGTLRMNDAVTDTTGHHSAFDISQTLTVSPGGTIDVNLVPAAAPHLSGPPFAPQPGDSFTLITWGSLVGDSLGVTFDFSDAPLGSGLNWQSSWGPATNGSLVLRVVPEPATVVSLFGGGLALAGLCLARSRKRRGTG